VKEQHDLINGLNTMIATDPASRFLMFIAGVLSPPLHVYVSGNSRKSSVTIIGVMFVMSYHTSY